MQKEKITKQEKQTIQTKIEHFYNFKGRPMVRISGNFMGGGFNMSKNKIKAILDNGDGLFDFVNGKFDQEILELAEDEILKP